MKSLFLSALFCSLIATNSYGESVSLTSKLGAFNPTQQAYPVQINAKLLQAQEGDRFELYYRTQKAVFTITQVKALKNGGYSIVAIASGLETPSVLTLMDTKTAVGHLVFADKKLQLKTDSQGLWLFEPSSKNRYSVKIDEGGIKVPHPPAGEKTLRPLREMIVNGTPVLDIMVLWDEEIEDRLGSLAAVQALIQQRIAMTNQAFADSQVNAEVRLVYSQKLDASSTVSNGTLLEDLQQNNGVFSEVEALRAQHGADMVGYLRQFNAASISAGIAYRLGDSGTISDTDKRYAYFVVADGEYKVGNRVYFSPENTFSHELGHILGAEHDHSHANSDSPIFPYAFGHDRPGEFATIMSYESNDGITEPVMKYSNPDILCTETAACGVEQGELYAADNARAFNQTASHIAGFYTPSYSYEPGEFLVESADNLEQKTEFSFLDANDRLLYSFLVADSLEDSVTYDANFGTAFIAVNDLTLEINFSGSMQSDDKTLLFPKSGFELPIEYEIDEQSVKFSLDLTNEPLEF